ncbi:unnamed protein product [Leuciscus chuanchicus]
MEMEMRAVRTSITRMAQRMDAFEEKMEQKMDELLMLLRSSQSLPLLQSMTCCCRPAQQSQSWRSSTGVSQLFLTTLGGSTRGTAIRRMLRGLPEKLPRADCSRWEDLIGQVLKFAPHRR